MRRMLVVLCCPILVMNTGCMINGINGLINGSKIDLSGVDLSSLASQASTLLSAFGGL